MRKPTIVQHSFGEPGSGGPVGVVERLMQSRLTDQYDFVRLHQHAATGSVDIARIRDWTAKLRLMRPDIVHVRGLGNEGFHAAVAARRASCPHILVSIHGTVRDLSFHRRSLRRLALTRWAEPLTMSIATDIATVCQFAAGRDFVHRHRKKLVGIVPNGTALPAIQPAVRGSTRNSLGYREDDVVGILVGRLSVEKGHLHLADALRQDRDVSSRLRLLIVGDGPDADVIERAYREVPGLRTTFLGRRHDVTALLGAADIFVFPSLHENLSNALIEGMAAGLPAVATAVGGNVEVLEQGGGILVPKHDTNALREALLTLMEDEVVRLSIGIDARRNVGTNYSLDRMIDGWDSVYRRILGRSNA